MGKTFRTDKVPEHTRKTSGYVSRVWRCAKGRVTTECLVECRGCGGESVGQREVRRVKKGCGIVCSGVDANGKGGTGAVQAVREVTASASMDVTKREKCLGEARGIEGEIHVACGGQEGKEADVRGWAEASDAAKLLRVDGCWMDQER